MNHNVLFYSNQCDYCNTILKQLKTNNVNDSQLIRICVDGNKNIPRYITKVPSIISKTHKQPLVDEAVYMWINTLINSTQQNSNHTHINTNHNTNQNTNHTQETQSINPYSPMEMTSTYSDSFSFIDNSQSNITHNFAFLDNSNNNISTQNVQTEKPDQEDEYSKYMSARDNDPQIQQPMRRI